MATRTDMIDLLAEFRGRFEYDDEVYPLVYDGLRHAMGMTDTEMREFFPGVAHPSDCDNVDSAAAIIVIFETCQIDILDCIVDYVTHTSLLFP